jgi:Tfp pilus assembly protein PilN
MARVKKTILLVLPEKIYIADFSNGSTPKLLGIEEKKRSKTSTTLSAAVDDAIVGRPLGKEVYVLGSDIWLQQITLSQNVVEHLSEPDLQRTLSFEAEFFSGIGAMESQSGVRVLKSDSGNTTFRFDQVQKSQFQQLGKLLQATGSRLAGISHPGGLALLIESLETGNPQQWQRLELWPDLVVALIGNGVPEETAIHIINGDPRSQKWQGEIDRWFESQGVPHCQNTTIFSQDSLNTSLPQCVQRGMADRTVTMLNLNLQSHAAKWLETWALHLYLQKDHSPLIQTSRKRSSLATTAQEERTSIRLMLVLTCLTFIGCSVLEFWMTKSKEFLMREQAFLQTSTRKIEQTEQQIQASKTQLEQKRKQKLKRLQDMEVLNEVFISQRKRYYLLLYQIGKQVPLDLMLEEILYQNQTIILKGFCLAPHLADEYAKNLKSALQKEWNVSPAAKLVTENGKAFKFGLAVTPLYNAQIAQIAQTPQSSTPVAIAKKP